MLALYFAANYYVYYYYINYYVADMLKLYTVRCFTNAVVDVWLCLGAKKTLWLGKDCILA